MLKDVEEDHLERYRERKIVQEELLDLKEDTELKIERTKQRNYISIRISIIFV